MSYSRPLNFYSYAWEIDADTANQLACPNVFGFVQIESDANVTVTIDGSSYTHVANDIQIYNHMDVHIKSLIVAYAGSGSANVVIKCSAPSEPEENLDIY